MVWLNKRDDGHNPDAVPGTAPTYLCLGPGWSNMCNTPFRRHKIWVHEGGTCTPLIATWPNGISAHGELRHTHGHIIDIIPTILDLAGISSDKQKQVSFPGQSLKPVFAQEINWQRNIWYYHEENRAVRSGNWKLVAARDEKWELFNLDNDRTETYNLAGSNSEKVIEMETLWNKMLNEIRWVLSEASHKIAIYWKGRALDGYDHAFNQGSVSLFVVSIISPGLVIPDPGIRIPIGHRRVRHQQFSVIASLLIYRMHYIFAEIQNIKNRVLTSDKSPARLLP